MKPVYEFRFVDYLSGNGKGKKKKNPRWALFFLEKQSKARLHYSNLYIYFQFT